MCTWLTFFRLLCLDNATTEKNVPVGYCYIECICVDGKFRGKGIGKVLMDVVETDAKRNHNCKVSVDVT